MASLDNNVNTNTPASQPVGSNTGVQTPTTVTLRTPSTYRKDVQAGSTEETNTWQPPSLNWLARTWTVTHSTLPMWRKAKNVRITYKLFPCPSSTSSSPDVDKDTLIDDEVTSEPTAKTLLPQPKSICGIDTPDHSVPGGGAWNWRGKGWLKIASSHWEILGWGEFEGEKWVLTWFEKSIFTPAGVDLYSERKGGVSERLLGEVRRVLREGKAGEGVRELCKGEELFAVVIDDA
ncbi:hypothetical protein WAI453_009957 [Rhynchosporium graminicola]|uniref:Uncharacterized protein n=1 Tax=Rhynchosporium graminicola TaxID=2792576 RepID=A0A1E1KEK1_9HELO|nr:uncharacterized protein RCO7_04885 [Rhynchosporium commune]